MGQITAGLPSKASIALAQTRWGQSDTDCTLLYSPLKEGPSESVSRVPGAEKESMQDEAD